MKKLLALLLALMMMGVSCFALADSDEEEEYKYVDIINAKGEVIGQEVYDSEDNLIYSWTDENNTHTYTEYNNGKVTYNSVYTYDDDDKFVSSTVESFDSDGNLAYRSVDENNTRTWDSYEDNQLVAHGIRNYEWVHDEEYDYDYRETVSGTTEYYDGSLITEKNEFDYKKGNYAEATFAENGLTEQVYYWDEEEGSATFDIDGNVSSGWVPTDDGYLWFDGEEGKWFDQDGAETAAPDLSTLFDLAGDIMGTNAKWYTNNTVCVAGASLRTLNPDLTSKWYTVVPVDLSQDGTQTFPLVAGNKYLIGSVSVTVAGDEVTTTYKYPEFHNFHIYPGEECLAWFTGVDQITSEFLDAPASETSFGTAISKASDLNGQDVALLFVCNRLTFRMPLNNQGASRPRYYPNTKGMASYFDNVTALLEKLGN